MIKITNFVFFGILLATINLSVNLAQSTDKTTIGTTPEPGFQLIKWANYSQTCTDVSVFCNTYGGTVYCSNRTSTEICECNLGEDAEFDEDRLLCVGKVNSLCFTEDNILGRKLCVENADCFPDKGTYEDHRVGTCKCLSGYEEDASGKCIDDISIPPEQKSTPRPTTTKSPRQTVPTTTTPKPSPSISTEANTAKPGNNNGSGHITNSGIFMISMLYILSKF